METKRMQRIYTGLFKDRESVEQVYNLIYKKGYNVKNMNLIMSVDTRQKYFYNEKSDRRVGLGSLVSTYYNGIMDVVNTGLTIPGKQVFVAGPVSAGLSGAGAGGFSTGIISSLLGIPDVYAQKFESGLQGGSIIMSIQPLNEEDACYMEEIWQQNQVEEVYRK